VKAAIGQMQQEYAFSERRACRLMTVAVSSYRYENRRSGHLSRRLCLTRCSAFPQFNNAEQHVCET
jgi:hypothetical protein